MVKSPIRWAGGKYRLRKKIIDMLPTQDSYSCYVEVFGGAGWILFGKDPSPVEIYNDIDGELVNFFKVLKSNPNALVKKIIEFPYVSREMYNSLLADISIKRGKVDRAFRFYYLLMAGWGGEWENPRFQTSIKDFGKGNRLFGALRNIRQKIYPASERLSSVIIEKLDWRDCIKRYDNLGTVMFIDPPYPGNTVNYLYNMLNIEEHQELANILKNVKCKWLLTCYNKPEIQKLYDGFNIYPVKFASGMDGSNGRKNDEIIVTNYEIAKKASPKNSWKDREAQTLLKEINAEINSQVVQDLIDLRKSGYIQDVPSFVTEAVKNALKKIK
jgi:DNA adenine methylase